ncbi:alpha/beta fold hydrolase [Undibacterium arcticum]
MAVQVAVVPFNQRTIRLEYQWLNAEMTDAPLIVFLHEGLGSLSMWKNYPQQLCDTAQCRGLVYSRYGYGNSTPRPHDEKKWPVDYMQQQALDVLPALLQAVGVDAAADKPWLFGHSDGASIALIYAASYPAALAGAIVLAPHVFVEDISIHGIEQARAAYLQTDLQQRLARYHADPDSAFWGWNDIWLAPDFRGWNIETLLPEIRCPVLALQGYDDEYGTMAQLDGIARRVPQAELLKLAACGHSPQRDQGAAVTAAATAFMARHSATAGAR